MTFKETDKLVDLQVVFWEKVRLLTDFENEDNCRLVNVNKNLFPNQNEDATIEEGFDVLFADYDNYQDSIIWVAIQAITDIPLETRFKLINCIAENDDIGSCKVYIFCPDLTDEEDLVLEAAFFPTMGTMRKAAQEKTLRRAKKGTLENGN